MITDDERAEREAVVREHMESENRHDFDATMATFSHPRYELIATGEVYDGEEAVRGYYARSRAHVPRPAQRGDRAPPRRRRRVRRVRPARHAHRPAGGDGPDRTRVPLPHGRVVPVRGRSHQLRARLLRLGTILRQLGLLGRPQSGSAATLVRRLLALHHEERTSRRSRDADDGDEHGSPASSPPADSDRRIAAT